MQLKILSKLVMGMVYFVNCEDFSFTLSLVCHVGTNLVASAEVLPQSTMSAIIFLTLLIPPINTSVALVAQTVSIMYFGVGTVDARWIVVSNLGNKCIMSNKNLDFFLVQESVLINTFLKLQFLLVNITQMNICHVQIYFCMSLLSLQPVVDKNSNNIDKWNKISEKVGLMSGYWLHGLVSTWEYDIKCVLELFFVKNQVFFFNFFCCCSIFHSNNLVWLVTIDPLSSKRLKITHSYVRSIVWIKTKTEGKQSCCFLQSKQVLVKVLLNS
jgi:hypothetical protein